MALYDFYQARVDECDVRTERTLAALSASKAAPQEHLAKARCRTRQPNALSFDERGAMYQFVGVGLHPDTRSRSLLCGTARRRMRHRSQPVAEREALHFLIDLVAGLQGQRREGAVVT